MRDAFVWGPSIQAPAVIVQFLKGLMLSAQLGWPAFISVLAIFWLMVVKPG